MQRGQRIRLVNDMPIPNKLNGIALPEASPIQGQCRGIAGMNGKRKTTRDEKNDDPLH
jgi:hypothetical protein